jgi:hypothetical protein
MGYTCEEIIDNFLIEGVNSAAVNFVNPIYLVSILNGSAAEVTDTAVGKAVSRRRQT